jgi:hypothetical protein
MCTEFPYCEKDAAPAGRGITHLAPPGAPVLDRRHYDLCAFNGCHNISSGSQIAAPKTGLRPCFSYNCTEVEGPVPAFPSIFLFHGCGMR